MIAIFLRQLNNEEPLTIVGDGHQRRDFVYVKDVAKANLSAAFSKQAFGGFVYNVGHGSMISVLEIANLISNNHVHLPERVGDARNTMADISLIENELGWTTSMDAVTWVKEHLQK